MKKLIYSLGLFLLFSSQSFAANGKSHDHSKDVNSPTLSDSKKTSNAACKNKIEVEVNGLVCDFCARAIEKVFSKREEVSAINVDLDVGKVTIAMKGDKSIDDVKIKKLITDSGYSVVKINRGCNE